MKKSISLFVMCIVVLTVSVLPSFAIDEDVKIVPTWSYTLVGSRGSANTEFVIVPYEPQSGDKLGLSVDFKNDSFPDPRWSYIEFDYKYIRYGSDALGNGPPYMGYYFTQRIDYDFDISTYDSGAVVVDIDFFSMYSAVNQQAPTPYLYVYDKSKKDYIPATELGMGVGRTYAKTNVTIDFPHFTYSTDSVIPYHNNITVYKQIITADISNIDNNYTRFRVSYYPRIYFTPSFPVNFTRDEMDRNFGGNVFYNHYKIPVDRGEITWTRDTTTAARYTQQKIAEYTSQAAVNTSIIVDQNEEIINSINSGFSDTQEVIQNSTTIIADSIETSTDKVVNVIENAPQEFVDDLQAGLDEVDGYTVEVGSWTADAESHVNGWFDDIDEAVVPALSSIESFNNSDFWKETGGFILSFPFVLSMIGIVSALAVIHFILTGKVT